MRAAAEPTPGAETRLPVSPFVKWAGGKGQLLGQLEPFFPPRETYRRYFEPFLGGGAVFFHLQPLRAVLTDLNDELLTAYQVIRDQLDDLLTSLRKHQDGSDYFYEVRALAPQTLSPVRRASRFIFLNKRCYNGLYRVNSKGGFNVPIGRNKRPPRIFDEANLRNVAALLKDADLRVSSYVDVLKEARAGDFVYLDPPYQPLSATAYFTSYTKHAFGEADQARLAEVLHELDARGARFLLNNHDTLHLRRLYSGFHLNVAAAKRNINSRADRRGAVAELIVTNYRAG